MIPQDARVCAAFVFNHKYTGNIEKLKRLYNDRFTALRFIMPFARETDYDVIPVYETSWNFSGHIAQAEARLPREENITHYLFIGDDLILNPAINEANLLDSLGISDLHTAYIKSLAPVDNHRFRWYRAVEAMLNFEQQQYGFDIASEIPTAKAARERFEAMGLVFRDPRPRSVREILYSAKRVPLNLGWAMALKGLVQGFRPLSYPFLFGYSDFVLVPAEYLADFAHYCGVFAALNMFAEIAVPTALALAVPDIATELEYGEHFQHDPRRRPGQMVGREFWDADETRIFVQQFDRSIARILTDFPANLLYAHPIKLSQFA
jgi:hypothetical protein